MSLLLYTKFFVLIWVRRSEYNPGPGKIKKSGQELGPGSQKIRQGAESKGKLG